MPRASAIAHPIQSKTFERKSLKTVPHLKTIPPFLNKSSLSAIASGLIKNGYFEFILENGAIGRFIYKDTMDGFYVGFALKNIEKDGYTIFGRVAFDIQPQGFIQGGYETISLYKPANECQELKKDCSTPILVSDGVKKGYKRIGSTLMGIAMEIAKTKKMSRIEILMPLADKFYVEKLGFKRKNQSDDSAGLYFPLNDSKIFSSPSIAPKNNGIEKNGDQKKKTK
jgi:hypothetical protein